MRIIKIGTTVFAVHRMYIKKKITGGRIEVCKVKTYQNIGGRIQCILKAIGSKIEVNTANYRIYHNLNDAILAISTKNKK